MVTKKTLLAQAKQMKKEAEWHRSEARRITKAAASLREAASNLTANAERKPKRTPGPAAGKQTGGGTGPLAKSVFKLVGAQRKGVSFSVNDVAEAINGEIPETKSPMAARVSAVLWRAQKSNFMGISRTAKRGRYVRG